MGTILHINAVGLMAGVELATDSALRGRPFVVASRGRSRAVVLDVSPEAYREGLWPGMPLAIALARVPDSTVVPPRPDLYREADVSMRNIALSFTPLVEPAGNGHLFIDLAGTSRMFGAPADATQKLRRSIVEATGLRPAFALSSHRTASKVATRVFRPGGFAVLSSRDETVILRQQPVGLLPGVGPALDTRLTMLGIDDIGTLADLDSDGALAVGQRGPELVARARCSDDGPVIPDRDAGGAVDSDVVFEPDTTDPEVLRSGLWQLASGLAFSLRKRGLGFARASVTITYVDGARDRASQSLRYPRGHGTVATRDDEAMALAVATFERATRRRVRVRRLALELSGLEPAGRDLDLFEPEPAAARMGTQGLLAGTASERLRRMQQAADSLRSRYGRPAVGPCFALHTADTTAANRSAAIGTPGEAFAAEEATAFAARMSTWGHL